MLLRVLETHLSTILPFRKKYLKENNFQIRYNACHERNWTDSYLLFIDNKAVGYGSVKGLAKLSDRDTIFEFYVVPSKRQQSSAVLKKLIVASNVKFMESQTNDLLTTQMLKYFCTDVEEKVILFGEGSSTNWEKENALFRPLKSGEEVFGKTEKDKGSFVLEVKNEVVADAGFMSHYNPPFADVYMDVSPNYRQKGYGSFIIQEVIKECYKAGKIPAARCHIHNVASKACLLKGGLKEVGKMLTGRIDNSFLQ